LSDDDAVRETVAGAASYSGTERLAAGAPSVEAACALIGSLLEAAEVAFITGLRWS
jgi:hypothetical protein